MKYLRVRNFEKFQHYRDRRPPWVKLHVSLLDDYDFIALADPSKAHVMLLWALASQCDNRIPYDLAWITQRIGARSPVDVEELILQGFLEPYVEGAGPSKYEKSSSRYVSAQTRTALLSNGTAICAACGATENLEIDHIIPISKGGTSDPTNLQVLCRQCNRRKRSRTRSADAASAEHVRSDVLRTTENLRSPETETETEREKETTRSTASPAHAAAPKGAVGWPARLALVWSDQVGPVKEGRVGAALKPAVDRHGLERVERAMRAYIAVRKSEGKPCNVKWFADESQVWVERTASRVDAIDGEMSPTLELMTRPAKAAS